MTALFNHILNTGITAGILVLVVVLLRFLLKKAPKYVNVLLWGIVALRLVMPFSIESSLSLVPKTDWIASEKPPVSVNSPESNIGGAESPDFIIDNPAPTQTPTENVPQTPVQNVPQTPVQTTPQAPTTPITPEPIPTVPAENSIRITDVLPYVWLGGVAVMLLYMALSYYRVHRSIKVVKKLRDNIYLTNTDSPFVLGIIKPKIYLSADLDEFSASYVIAHEETHIRRRDHWWKPLGFLLLSVHWFNPLLWLSYILLCKDIEMACDERVVRDMASAERANYSEALLACSISKRVVSACPLAFGEVSVKERIRSVLSYKKPAFWIVLIAVIACIATAVCFLTNPMGTPPTDEEEKESESSTDTPTESPTDISNITHLSEFIIGMQSTEIISRPDVALIDETTVQESEYPVYVNRFALTHAGPIFNVNDKYTENITKNLQDFLFILYGENVSASEFSTPSYAIEIVLYTRGDVEFSANADRINVSFPKSEMDAEITEGSAKTNAYLAAAMEYLGIDEPILKTTLDYNLKNEPHCYSHIFSESTTDHSEYLWNTTFNYAEIWGAADLDSWHLAITKYDSPEIHSTPEIIPYSAAVEYIKANFPTVDTTKLTAEIYYARLTGTDCFTPCYRFYFPSDTPNITTYEIPESCEYYIDIPMISADLVYPVIPHDEIKLIFNNMILLEKYRYDPLGYLFPGVDVLELEPYLKVTNERYDTYAEWTAFVESIYTGEMLEQIKGELEEAFIDVDGYTYVTPTAFPNYFSDEYTYRIVESGENTAKITLTRTYAPVGLEATEEYFTYVLTKTDAGWRISDRVFETSGTDTPTESAYAVFEKDGGIYLFDEKNGTITTLISDEKYNPILSDDNSMLLYTKSPFAALQFGVIDIEGNVIREIDIDSSSSNAITNKTWITDTLVGVQTHVNPSTSEYFMYDITSGELTQKFVGYSFTPIPNTDKIIYAKNVPHFSNVSVKHSFVIGDTVVYTSDIEDYYLENPVFSPDLKTVIFRERSKYTSDLTLVICDFDLESLTLTPKYKTVGAGGEIVFRDGEVYIINNYSEYRFNEKSESLILELSKTPTDPVESPELTHLKEAVRKLWGGATWKNVNAITWFYK